MQSNNISTEFIFSLFLKFYPRVLSSLVGYDIKKIELEKNFFGRKIDAYSKIGSREVFIENQLRRSDEMHLNQINIIINRLKKKQQAIIIWIAGAFDENMIKAVVEEVKRCSKNIEFIALEINDEIIRELQKLRRIHEFEIIDNLNKVYSKCEKYNMEVIFKSYKKYIEVEYVEDSKLKKELTDKDKIMKKISEEMKKQLYYFPTVHRERRRTNVIVLGSGMSDINYTIGINRSMELFTELKFHNSKKEIFNFLYKNKNKIEDELDYLICWDLEFFKIYSKVKYSNDKEKMIKRQVRILEKLVQFFSAYKDEFIKEIN